MSDLVLKSPLKLFELYCNFPVIDPNRYRHSPERLKKASQDEASTHVHQGRRQSGKAGAVRAERLLSRTLDHAGNLLQQHLGLALTLRKSWERAGRRVNGVCL